MAESPTVPGRHLNTMNFVKRLNQLSLDKINLLNDIVSHIGSNIVSDETAFAIQEDAFDQFMSIDKTMNRLVKDLFFRFLQVQSSGVIHDERVHERVNASEDKNVNEPVPHGNH